LTKADMKESSIWVYYLWDSPYFGSLFVFNKSSR